MSCVVFWGLRPLPPTPIKNKLATQLAITLRDPAGLLVRSPGKPCHTTFLTVAGIPRRFSSVPPENLVTPKNKTCHTTFITVAGSRGASRAFWSHPPSPDEWLSEECFTLYYETGDFVVRGSIFGLLATACEPATLSEPLFFLLPSTKKRVKKVIQ